MFPEPRISRSLAAMRKPAPRSQNSWIEASRRRATSESATFSRDQQVRVRGLVAPADAAAQLVELREAVGLGAVDQDRVGRRDVEAVLDDRRREEHVGLARVEPHHRLLELRLAHRAVGDGRSRTEGRSSSSSAGPARSTRPGCGRRRPGPPRSISASIASRMTSGFARHDLRLDREPVARRRLDDREVAQPRERRGAASAGSASPTSTSTSIDAFHSFSFSFCATPKRCSSSTMRRPRSRNARSLPSIRCVAIRMSTEPVGDLLDDRLLLRARAEAREQLDRHREGGEAALERPEVLVGEDRRRREQRHLLAVEHGLEGGAHGDLGLAVADVAAEQAVHRLRRLHVALDVGDRLRLVGRLVVLERVLELLLPRRVLGEGEPVARGCGARRASGAGRSCRASPS